MKSVIVAWCNKDERAFEQSVPLYFVGKRNSQLGFKATIQVLFLSGFDRLSDMYKACLRDVGYILHDVSDLFMYHNDRYKVLDRFGDYEKKCFLRWLVMHDFFSGEPLVHYDGDIVFNEDPALVAQKVEGLTFILQGCPAFAVISDSAWFRQYQNELDLLVKDINGYSYDAWEKRDGWEVTLKTRWAGYRLRPIITSDQDFLSHLIHTATIKQDSVEVIMQRLDDYIICQNPLVFHLSNENTPYVYSRENGVDYFSFKRFDEVGLIYKKKMLLWHMQSSFNFYASKYLLRQKLFGFLPLGRVNLDLSEQCLGDRFNRRLNRFFKHINRLEVYRYFFQNTDFSGLFGHWWKKEVFKGRGIGMKELGNSVVFQWKESSFYHRLNNTGARDDVKLSLKYLNDKKARILEAGCGLGEIVRFLSDSGYENIEGVEINHKPVAFLNEKFPQLKVIQGDLLKLPYEKDSFDAVLSYGVIEHFPDGPQAPLQALYNILKPGGIGVISVPSFNPIRRFKYFLSFLNITKYLDIRKNNVVRKWFNKKPYPEWAIRRNGKKHSYYIQPQYGTFFEYRLTKKQFEKLCRDAGFEILESVATDHMAGVYQEFGWPFVTLNKDEDFDVKPMGNFINKLFSKIPFFHNHFHVCVLQKKTINHEQR